MEAVIIKNLNFKYNNIEVFNDFNLNIENGSFTTIIGEGSIGKSTLFKILASEVKYSGTVLIFNKSIRYNLEKGYLGLVSADVYSFSKKTVKEELINILEIKGKAISKIDDEIQKITKKLGIKKILNYKIKDIDLKEKILLMFAREILSKPKVLIIDNALDYLDNEKEKVIKELIRLNKKDSTIINITNNTEDCLVGKEIVIIGDDLQVFKTSKITEEDFLSNNLEVPFMISLSNKLKFYKICEKNYLKMEKLVDDLWQ